MKAIVLPFFLLMTSAFALTAQPTAPAKGADANCLEKDFTNRIELGHGRFLANKNGTKYIVNEAGDIVLDLSKYQDILVPPFRCNRLYVKDKESAKYGYIDSNGVLTIPLQYDGASNFHDKLAVVSQSGKYGIIDTANQLVLAFEYEELAPPRNGKVPAKKNGKFGLIDFDQSVLMDFQYERLFFFRDGLLKAKDEKGVFLLDATSGEAKTSHCEAIVNFEGDTLRFKQDEKWGLMDVRGQTIVDNQFDQIGLVEKGFALVRRDRKDGLINTDGIEVLPMVYDRISKQRNFIKAELDGTNSFYNYDGNPILSLPAWPTAGYVDLREMGPDERFVEVIGDSTSTLLNDNWEEVFKGQIFEDVKSVSERFVLAKQDAQWYFFPLDGSDPLGPFETAKPFYKGLAIVGKQGKQSLINCQGDVIITCDKIQNLRGAYQMRSGDKWGMTDDVTKRKVDFLYDKLTYKGNDFFITQTDGKKGFVSFRPFRMAPPIYQGLKVPYDPSCPYIIIEQDDRYGLLDRSGQLALAPQFRYIDFAKNCHLKIEASTGDGMLNGKLELVIDTIYESILKPHDGILHPVKKNKLWGFVDLEGNTVIDHRFKEFHSFRGKQEYAAVLEGEQWHLIDKKGARISDDSYSNVVEVWGRIDELYQVQNEGKWGLIRTDGHPVFPLIFESMSHRRGKWTVSLEGKSFIINESLECIQDCPEADWLKEYGIQTKKGQ
ncbi:MAG: WG repeat-containing protein [Bacteroidota bacterium]